MLQSLKNKKILIIIAIVLLAIIGKFTSNEENNSETFKSNNPKTVNLDKYKSYIEKSNKAILNFSVERKKSRNKIYNELVQTSTYENLVKNKITSIDYLPVITAINNGIREIYISKKREPLFLLSKSLTDIIKVLNDGEDKLDFALNSIVLSTPNKGGLPKELIEVFERYRLKYNIYGKKSLMYDANSNIKAEIKHPYNMSSIFAYILPTNQTYLSEVYQSSTNGVSSWLKNDKDYVYPQLATKQGYLEYIEKNNIFKEEIQTVTVTSNASFWKLYSPEVKERILNYIANKDCNGLQKEFNIASDNSKSQKARTGQNNAELMSFIDENMRSLGCYSN